MKSTETLQEAIESLKLTTLKAFYKTGLGDDGDDTAHWAGIIHPRMSNRTTYAKVYAQVQAHHDFLLNNKVGIGRTSRFAPEKSPAFKGVGTGPEHFCPSPSTCTTAPDWFEDHCHIYLPLIEYSDLHRELNSDELGAYTRLRLNLLNSGDSAWSSMRSAPPTIEQRRLMGKKLGVTTQRVNAFEKKRAAHTLKRSDLYAVLAPYYDRLTGEALKKFRGGNIDIDDIKAYAKEALSSCLSTYNPEKKVPLQAYVRATIASRVIDRLRFEGIFTRFEGSMINAIRVVAPDWTAGEKLPEKSLKKAAVALKVSVPSLRSSIAAYELKSERLYIDHNAGGDSEESFSIQIKAADSFTPEFHIDATADRELRSKILERIFTNQDPKTYQVVLNWFIGDGDRSTDEVKNTMADTGLTYMNLATFVNGVIGEAIETNGIDDGFEWESLDELEQFVDTNEQDEATRRDIRVYSKAHRARAIEREESNRRDIEAYSKAYRARHASPNAPHDAG